MTKLVAGVTGGARGIGKAYAEALVQRGYCVVIFDIVGAIELSAVINTPATFTGYDCDCSDATTFRSAFEAGLKYFQVTSYTVFVCNAGIVRSLFSEAERQIQVNLIGAIHGVEMAIKVATDGFQHPAPSPNGLNVIVTASTNGIVPADSDLAPIYVATKFALVGLVRSLKPLSSRYAVRVNAVAPVTVETPMVADMLPPEARAFLDREGRGGVMAPERCAAALLHILDTPSLSGDVVVVHPNAPGGTGFAVEPLIASSWLGAWRADESTEVATFVDEGLQAASTGDMPAWSGI